MSGIRLSADERQARQEKLEEWRTLVREGAPCPKCGARRRQRCDDGRRKRNHQERQDRFEEWFREQQKDEQLDQMLGRLHRG